MKDISYIVPSKNDNYDPQNLDKLILSTNTNVQQLLDLGLVVQVLMIDWCSENPFHTLDRFKNEIKVPVNHVYIDKSLLIADGLNPDRYYEYFAKNVGIRRAEGNYVLVENSDILNDEDLAKSLKTVIDENKKGFYFRPSLRVNVWYPNIDEYTHYNTIDDKPYGDLNPGDFMMVTKEDWLKAQAYDETNQGHRGLKRQTNMDVEMLAQFVKHGVTVSFVQGYYRHMDHDRKGLNAEQQFGESAQTRNLAGYENRSTWGFTNAVVEEKDGVMFLKA